MKLNALAFSVLLAAQSTPVLANRPSGPSDGPAPRDEESVLWEEGRKAFEQGHPAECVRTLQRLVERHPGAPGYLRAHYLLGQCYLSVGEAGKAVAPLKHYVEATPMTPEGTQARLGLARAEIATGKFNEALLLTTELITRQVDGADRLATLILKSRALLGLDEDVRAGQALASFRKESQTLGAISPLTEEASYVDLQLKLRACARLPEKDAREEGKIRSQFRARGQCVQEALLMLKTAIQGLSATEWLDRSLSLVTDSVEAQKKWVEAKLPSPPGKRKATEQKTYEKELRAALREDLYSFSAQAKQLLQDWKLASPAAARYIDPLMRALP